MATNPSFVAAIRLLVCLAAFAAAPVAGQQPANVPSQSGTICGGPNQAPCGYKWATFVGKAQGHCPFVTEDASGRITSITRGPLPNSRQSFSDLGRWQCWICPKGYDRRITDPVDSDRACSRRDVQGVSNNIEDAVFSKATYNGRLCPFVSRVNGRYVVVQPGTANARPSFYDGIRGGECWICPEGYERSHVPVTHNNACIIRARTVFARASRYRNAKIPWSHQCPGGFFHDGWDGGGCWKCPPGYGRHVFTHINNSDACSRVVKQELSGAIKIKAASCEPGEISDLKIGEGTQDPRAGGGCWTCPAEYTRFPLAAIDTHRACKKEAALDFEKATFVGDLTCPAGQYYDMIKLSVALTSWGQYARRQAEIRAVEAASGRKVEIDTPGTCWSCPVGYHRTGYPVYNNNACVSKGIEWYTAPYPEPGFFALKGASGVLLEAIQKKPALVEAAIKAADPRSESKLFHEAPHKSAAAVGVVFAQLLTALKDQAPASVAEKLLIESFKEYVTKRRTYIAQDALAQYYAWKDWDRNRRPTRDDGGPRYPAFTPDFTPMAVAGMAGSKTAGIAASLLPKVGDIASITLGAAGNRFNDFTSVDRALPFLARAGMEYAIGKGLEAVAAFLGAGSSLGPQVVIGVTIAVSGIFVDAIIKEANALAYLQTALLTAKSDPNLARLATTDKGTVELMTYWSYAMAGESQPAAGYLAMLERVSRRFLTGAVR